MSALVRNSGSSGGAGGGGGGGGGERPQHMQVARHSARSNGCGGGGDGGTGTLPGIAPQPQPRGSEPGTPGNLLPKWNCSDRSAIICRTTPAQPKERDAMRRIQPTFLVGRRNPITAEWAIADAQIVAPHEVHGGEKYV